jgi:threonine synthase
MKFVSTRNPNHQVSIREALKNGLAPDGGLYVPSTLPKFQREDFKNSRGTHAEVACTLLRPFFAEDAALASALPKVCEATFQFPIPLAAVPGKPGEFILELFHGPTSAFKDVGARFLANVMEVIIRDEALREGGGPCLNVDSHSHVNRSPHLDKGYPPHSIPLSPRKTVLVATSGDTGGAVAGAFFGKPNMDVAILFPEGKISARQEKQLCAWGGNVHAFAVKGTFDDCQRIVKEALVDQSEIKTSANREWLSANSINLCRILPQMVYYAFAALQFESASFVIPSGNLGNSLACVWAKKIGLPIGEIELGLNANRGVEEFFRTGNFKVYQTTPTLANAMDVSNPSNLERLRNLIPDLNELKKFMHAESVTDDEICAEIRTSQKNWGQVLCPHTAVAAIVRKRNMQMRPSTPKRPYIVVATAHPAKFESIVEPLIGHALPIPETLAEILLKPLQKTKIEPSYAAFMQAMAQL